MARNLSPTAVAVARQVRHVRWRRNALAAQTALYGTVAALAAAAAATVLLALYASTPAFAAGAVASAALALASSGLALRAARRRWLARHAAPHWVDDAAGLDGRTATLLGLAARGPCPGEAFLLPVLEAESARTLAAWRPDRLVPADVPPGPAVAALAAATALGAVLVLAPRIAPPLPPVLGVGDLASVTLDGSEATAVALVPGARGGATAGAGRAGGDDGAGGATAGDDAAGATGAAALQERLREALWGERWQRVRDALAASARRRATHGTAARDGGRAGERPAAARRAADGVETAEGAVAGSPARDDAVAARAGTPRGTATDVGTGGAPGAGAGTGSDDALYGEAAPAAGGDDGTFPLAIAARVRTIRLGSRRPEGAPPPAGGDARPALAARQRPEAALHKPVVPPAWEQVVRGVFRHRTPAEEGR
jgi:hypothetical protein